MSRNVLVAILLMVVFLVVAGAFYLEIALSSRATDTVYMVTQAVQAGESLGANNVRRTRIPRSGDTLDYFRGPLKAESRADHEMSAGTILFSHDLLPQDMALVNLTLRTPPSLAHGQKIDVYAQIGTQTILLDRGLAVDQVTTNSNTNAGNGSCSVWVTTDHEPAWIALQAANVPFFAARSTGIGVSQQRLNTQDALAILSGGSTGPPVVLPSPTPTRKP